MDPAALPLIGAALALAAVALGWWARSQVDAEEDARQAARIAALEIERNEWKEQAQRQVEAFGDAATGLASRAGADPLDRLRKLSGAASDPKADAPGEVPASDDV